MLLIDFDLRKPSIPQLFGLWPDPDTPVPPGVVECLAGQVPFAQAVTRETGHAHLHLLCGGRRAPNPGELIQPPRIAEVLREACRHYDHVVIDSAPLLAVR